MYYLCNFTATAKLFLGWANCLHSWMKFNKIFSEKKIHFWPSVSSLVLLKIEEAFVCLHISKKMHEMYQRYEFPICMIFYSKEFYRNAGLFSYPKHTKYYNGWLNYKSSKTMPKNAQYNFNHKMQQFEVKNDFRTTAFIVSKCIWEHDYS